jgi:hypothetical protein
LQYGPASRVAANPKAKKALSSMFTSATTRLFHRAQVELQLSAPATGAGWRGLGRPNFRLRRDSGIDRQGMSMTITSTRCRNMVGVDLSPQLRFSVLIRQIAATVSDQWVAQFSAIALAEYGIPLRRSNAGPENMRAGQRLIMAMRYHYDDQTLRLGRVS